MAVPSNFADFRTRVLSTLTAEGSSGIHYSAINKMYKEDWDRDIISDMALFGITNIVSLFQVDLADDVFIKNMTVYPKKSEITEHIVGLIDGTKQDLNEKNKINKNRGRQVYANRRPNPPQYRSISVAPRSVCTSGSNMIPIGMNSRFPMQPVVKLPAQTMDTRLHGQAMGTMLAGQKVDANTGFTNVKNLPARKVDAPTQKVDAPAPKVNASTQKVESKTGVTNVPDLSQPRLAPIRARSDEEDLAYGQLPYEYGLEAETFGVSRVSKVVLPKPTPEQRAAVPRHPRGVMEPCKPFPKNFMSSMGGPARPRSTSAHPAASIPAPAASVPAPVSKPVFAPLVPATSNFVPAASVPVASDNVPLSAPLLMVKKCSISPGYKRAIANMLTGNSKSHLPKKPEKRKDNELASNAVEPCWEQLVYLAELLIQNDGHMKQIRLDNAIADYVGEKPSIDHIQKMFGVKTLYTHKAIPNMLHSVFKYDSVKDETWLVWDLESIKKFVPDAETTTFNFDESELAALNEPSNSKLDVAPESFISEGFTIEDLAEPAPSTSAGTSNMKASPAQKPTPSTSADMSNMEVRTAPVTRPVFSSKAANSKVLPEAASKPPPTLAEQALIDSIYISDDDFDDDFVKRAFYLNEGVRQVMVIIGRLTKTNTNTIDAIVEEMFHTFKVPLNVSYMQAAFNVAAPTLLDAFKALPEFFDIEYPLVNVKMFYWNVYVKKHEVVVFDKEKRFLESGMIGEMSVCHGNMVNEKDQPVDFKSVKFGPAFCATSNVLWSPDAIVSSTA